MTGRLDSIRYAVDDGGQIPYKTFLDVAFHYASLTSYVISLDYGNIGYEFGYILNILTTIQVPDRRRLDDDFDKNMGLTDDQANRLNPNHNQQQPTTSDNNNDEVTPQVQPSDTTTPDASSPGDHLEPPPTHSTDDIYYEEEYYGDGVPPHKNMSIVNGSKAFQMYVKAMGHHING